MGRFNSRKLGHRRHRVYSHGSVSLPSIFCIDFSRYKDYRDIYLYIVVRTDIRWPTRLRILILLLYGDCPVYEPDPDHARRGYFQHSAETNGLWSPWSVYYTSHKYISECRNSSAEKHVDLGGIRKDQLSQSKSWRCNYFAPLLYCTLCTST